MAKEKELSVRQRKVMEQKNHFAASESLLEAFVRADRGIDAHSRFIHYTTLSRIVQKLETKRWWLSRADSDCLNDVQEARKYGNPELLGRTYQTSFSYGSAESAAMWGLYCPGDPFAVMVSIDGSAMRGWFREIRKKKFKACLEYKSATSRRGRCVELSKGQIDYADARDVIYAATDFADSSSRGKGKNRTDILSWFGGKTHTIENIAEEINNDKVTGWIKDYEWRQENESRIVVRVKNIVGKLPDYLSVDTPDYVLKSMRFTLSPWLEDELYEEVDSIIRTLVMELHDERLPKNIVSRSVIAGALESWRNRCVISSQRKGIR